MPGGSLWDRFTADPRNGANAHLRASDADRDVVNDLLGTAYAEGRLTSEELDQRTDQVARSRTLGELPPIIDDLVSRSDMVPTRLMDFREEAEVRYRHQRTNALWGFLTPTLVCWTIWALIGGGFPWPIFVTIATGAKFVQLATTPKDSIASIQRELERKERKRLESRRNRDWRG